MEGYRRDVVIPCFFSFPRLFFFGGGGGAVFIVVGRRGFAGCAVGAQDRSSACLEWY
jgi:hypothetical protein